ncbi:hypothetical protein TD95_004736 [Thielaviopsis punctulata]|uniref:Extragenic suppressor of kinetochore protein 1 n=1 Tax=Thielaviopsis punctulata TaxID=72032 RepID=A0A0F4Z9R9_9PEZI|nr:hypothetical protein TD95_004736 [Thielaviopsis punctulata]
MFWRFGGYANGSAIDSILEKSDFTLEELLDQTDLIQELKQHNARLIEYLRDDAVLQKLIKYVVAPRLEPVATTTTTVAAAGDDSSSADPSNQDLSDSESDAGPFSSSSSAASSLTESPSEKRPELIFSRPRALSLAESETNAEEDDPDKKRKHYAYVASEVLASDTWSIYEALMQNANLFPEFWQFLKRPSPLDPLQAGYFTKVNEALFDKKTEEMVEVLKRMPDAVSDLLSHVECPMIMDLLLKIIALDRKEGGQGLVEWLYSQNIVPILVACLAPERNWVVQTAAGDFLKAIITISANASQTDQQCIGPNELTRQLVSRQCVEQLIQYMLGGGNPLTVGVGIVIEVIRKNNSDYDPDVGSEVGTQPTSRDPIYLGTLLRLFAEHVPDFMNLIMNGPSRKSAVNTTFGDKLEPLGFDRFKTCELMAELLHCSNMGLLNEPGAEEVIAARDAERHRLRAEGRLYPQYMGDDMSMNADDLTMRSLHHEENRRLEVTNADDDFEEVESSNDDFVRAEDEIPPAMTGSFMDKDDDDFVDEPLSSHSSPRINIIQHREHSSVQQDQDVDAADGDADADVSATDLPGPADESLDLSQTDSSDLSRADSSVGEVSMLENVKSPSEASESEGAFESANDLAAFEPVNTSVISTDNNTDTSKADSDGIDVEEKEIVNKLEDVAIQHSDSIERMEPEDSTASSSAAAHETTIADHSSTADENSSNANTSFTSDVTVTEAHGEKEKVRASEPVITMDSASSIHNDSIVHSENAAADSDMQQTVGGGDFEADKSAESETSRIADAEFKIDADAEPEPEVVPEPSIVSEADDDREISRESLEPTTPEASMLEIKNSSQVSEPDNSSVFSTGLNEDSRMEDADKSGIPATGDDFPMTGGVADAMAGGDYQNVPPVVGDLLKMQFVEYGVVPTILSFFFSYPWNNFLHNVVYDIVQQVFNGPIDRGYNPALAISLFESADITAAIIKGQVTSDESQAKTNMRMGYMGHLTLIAEEVVKFTERHAPELLSDAVLDKVMSQEWINYVDGPLAETRERDNAILGGVRPEDAINARNNMGMNDLGGSLQGPSSLVLSNTGSNALASAGLNGGLGGSSGGLASGSNNMDSFAISKGLTVNYGSSSDEDDDDDHDEDITSEFRAYIDPLNCNNNNVSSFNPPSIPPPNPPAPPLNIAPSRARLQLQARLAMHQKNNAGAVLSVFNGDSEEGSSSGQCNSSGDMYSTPPARNPFDDDADDIDDDEDDEDDDEDDDTHMTGSAWPNNNINNSGRAMWWGGGLNRSGGGTGQDNSDSDEDMEEDDDDEEFGDFAIPEEDGASSAPLAMPSLATGASTSLFGSADGINNNSNMTGIMKPIAVHPPTVGTTSAIGTGQKTGLSSLWPFGQTVTRSSNNNGSSSTHIEGIEMPSSLGEEGAAGLRLSSDAEAGTEDHHEGTDKDVKMSGENEGEARVDKDQQDKACGIDNKDAEAAGESSGESDNRVMATTEARWRTMLDGPDDDDDEVVV